MEQFYQGTPSIIKLTKTNLRILMLVFAALSSWPYTLVNFYDRLIITICAAVGSAIFSDDQLSNLSSKEVLMEPFFSSKLSCLVEILSSFRLMPSYFLILLTIDLVSRCNRKIK